MKKAKIALEDGTVFQGYSFGVNGERRGEVVFNTGLTGYQEILTDPSYRGQIVVMTYPLIGNYGINLEDVESRQIFLEGLIVKECSRTASSWRSEKTLSAYLKENNILGIEGIDTRALTRRIRLKGAMKAVISTEDSDDLDLISKAKDSASLVGRDLVTEVTNRKISYCNEKGIFRIVVVDCGVKFNILRELIRCGCEVLIVPADTKSDAIMDMNPDGVLISNGPGDPAAVTYVIDTIKKLIGKVPLSGICLGHQLIGLALGGKTYKLKFGHHGANHPVKDLLKDKISITAQNHGFCLDADSLNKNDIELTHINLNDKTLEGIRHRNLPIFSIQFHPESSPGPHDANYLFNEFIEIIKKNG